MKRPLAWPRRIAGHDDQWVRPHGAHVAASELRLEVGRCSPLSARSGILWAHGTARLCTDMATQ